MFNDDDNDSFEITGSLMLAHPHLKDPNFVRSVVLMTAHEDEGSLGVVINRSAGLVLGEVDPSFEKYGLQDVPLYIGGPVASDQLILAGWKVDSVFNEFQLFFGLDPAKHEEFTKLVQQSILDGTSKWSAKIAITGRHRVRACLLAV